MTQLSVRGCRLRFTRAAATYMVACPSCGAAPLPAASASQALAAGRGAAPQLGHATM